MKRRVFLAALVLYACTGSTADEEHAVTANELLESAPPTDEQRSKCYPDARDGWQIDVALPCVVRVKSGSELMIVARVRRDRPFERPPPLVIGDPDNRPKSIAGEPFGPTEAGYGHVWRVSRASDPSRPDRLVFVGPNGPRVQRFLAIED